MCITIPMHGIICTSLASRCLLLHCIVRTVVDVYYWSYGTVVTDGCMHVRIQFSSYWVWYYTYLVRDHLSIAVGVLYLAMPCCVELTNVFFISWYYTACAVGQVYVT